MSGMRDEHRAGLSEQLQIRGPTLSPPVRSSVRAVGQEERAVLEDRILEGALHALTRRIPSGISITDVALSAKVSRGTVYKYFSDKESLLAALADYERRRYDASLRKALADCPPGAERIMALIDHTVSYFRTHPSLQLLLDIEPGFVLDNLRHRLPAMIATASEFLAPMLTETAGVEPGVATPERLSHLLVRVLLSIFLLPGTDDDQLSLALAEFIDLLVSPHNHPRTTM